MATSLPKGIENNKISCHHDKHWYPPFTVIQPFFLSSRSYLSNNLSVVIRNTGKVLNS